MTEGTWSVDGDAVVLIADGEERRFDLIDEMLVYENEEGGMSFGRDQAQPGYVPGQSVIADDAHAFDGTWRCFRVTAFDVSVPYEMAASELGEVLGDGIEQIEIRGTDVRMAGGEIEHFEFIEGKLNAAGGLSRILTLLDDGRADGCLSSNHCMGTYLHGILDNPAFIDILLRPFANKTGTDNYADTTHADTTHADTTLSDTTLSDTTHAAATADPQAFKQQQYDRLAEHVRKYVDMEKLYQILR